MKHRYTYLLISLVLFQFHTVLGQTTKLSNDFLAIGVGARAHGMGNAQVASIGDVTAGYWNPAGLVHIDSAFQVGAMHAEWFAGIANYDFLSFAKPLRRSRKSAIGLSVIRMGIDNIPNTFNLVSPDGTINYDNVTEFSATDYAILLSYARQLKNPNWSVGGNAKVIRRIIGKFGSAWGFGFDLGVQYRKGNWMFGLVGRDITSTFNAWTFNYTESEKIVLANTGNDIPTSSQEITVPRFVLAAAYQRQFGQQVSLLAEVNFDFTLDGQRNVLISSKNFNVDPHMGIELGYKQFLYLRGGINNIQNALNDIDGKTKELTMQPNFGVGLRLGRFRIDYALTDIGDVSQVLYSHIFSLVFDLKRKKRKKRAVMLSE